MSNNRKLGDIELKDYLRIVRRERPFRWLRALAVAGACILAFTAGVLSPLSGKHADRISLAEALEMLASVSQEEWEPEQAVFALHKQMSKGMRALEGAAESEEQYGKDASLYLLHLTRSGLAGIQRLVDSSPHRGVHQESLRLIRKDLRTK